MKSKPLPNTTCVHCFGQFEYRVGEASNFMRMRLDKKYRDSYLIHSMPRVVEMPGGKKRKIRTVRQLVGSHCPYCREVVFGEPDPSWLVDFSSIEDDERSKLHAI